MPNVLTAGSEVKCGHGQGKVSLQGVTKLTVGGKGVVLRSGVDNRSISGCATQDSSSTKKCSLSKVVGGEAAKLTVGDKGVMLESISGSTVGNPPGKLSGSANQKKLSAV